LARNRNLQLWAAPKWPGCAHNADTLDDGNRFRCDSEL
jgi:hypothetical protein